MANTYTTLNDLFVAMADAIRTKKNSTENIVADNFPTEIRNLKTGFDYNNPMVISIADNEFKNCEDLLSVDCAGVTSVGANAFEGCENLKSVVLYEGVTNVGENAFKGCDDDLVIYCYFESQPEGWHENWNPDGCEVVWLGGAIETWDISATENDNVIAKLYNDGKNEGMYLLIIDGIGSMADYASNSSPWHSSYRTSITSVLIYDNVTSIGSGAFYGCSGLISITIPDSVTSIGKDSFLGCTDLTSITYTGTISQWNTITFGTIWNQDTDNYTIHCIDGDIAKDGTITYYTTPEEVSADG